MIRRRGIQYPGKCCFKRLPRTREREIRIEEFFFARFFAWVQSSAPWISFRFHRDGGRSSGAGDGCRLVKYSVFVEYGMRGRAVSPFAFRCNISSRFVVYRI